MTQIGTLQLVIQKLERSYHMLLPLGAPVEEALDVALEFVSEIRKIQSQQAAQAAQAAAPAEPADAEPAGDASAD